jgi:hypothetical protein
MRGRFEVLLVVSFILIAILSGSYAVRWFSVVALGAVLALFLFSGGNLPVLYRGLLAREKPERSQKLLSDFERTVRLVQKAKGGRTARKLVADRIAEMYAMASDDYNQTFRRIQSEPNRAIRVLYGEGDFLDNLEKSLEIVEGDIDESGGSRSQGEGSSERS